HGLAALAARLGAALLGRLPRRLVLLLAGLALRRRLLRGPGVRGLLLRGSRGWPGVRHRGVLDRRCCRLVLRRARGLLLTQWSLLRWCGVGPAARSPGRYPPSRPAGGCPALRSHDRRRCNRRHCPTEEGRRRTP